MHTRDPKLDVIKGLAIVLVVFGHLIEPYSKNGEFFRYIYSQIYAFHVPIFVFAAGVVAKRTLNKIEILRALRRILLPFVIFHISYAALGYLRFGHLVYGWLTPHWIMWFLLSLFFWRIMLPLFASRIGILASVVIALAAGLSEQIGYPLSLSRTLYFFPFYVVGNLYGGQLINLKRGSRSLWLVSALIGGAFVASLVWKGVPVNVLYGSFPYPLGSEMKAMVLRALLLANSALLVVSISNLMLEKSTCLEYLGRRSLAIYLLHGLMLWPVGRQIGTNLHPAVTLMICVIATVVICAICALCSPIISLITGVGSREEKRPSA